MHSLENFQFSRFFLFIWFFASFQLSNWWWNQIVKTEWVTKCSEFVIMYGRNWTWCCKGLIWRQLLYYMRFSTTTDFSVVLSTLTQLGKMCQNRYNQLPKRGIRVVPKWLNRNGIRQWISAVGKSLRNHCGFSAIEFTLGVNWVFSFKMVMSATISRLPLLAPFA